jgi:hypothetical protein
MTHARINTVVLSALLGTAVLVLPCRQARAQNPVIGLISKVIQDVTRRVTGQEWEKALRGQTLASGDMVRTGQKSYAILKLKDNSLLRLREESEVIVTGTLRGKDFSKSIQVRQGVVGFNIKPQAPNEQFRFSSPTSVASVKGTGGVLRVNGSDTLTVVEGLVSLTNTVSSASVDVPAGFTGISRPDGTVERRASTAAEISAAEEAMRTGDQPRQLKLELRNNQGQTKDLIIEFKEQ